jgi:hypothetical protein
MDANTNRMERLKERSETEINKRKEYAYERHSKDAKKEQKQDLKRYSRPTWS